MCVCVCVCVLVRVFILNHDIFSCACGFYDLFLAARAFLFSRLAEADSSRTGQWSVQVIRFFGTGPSFIPPKPRANSSSIFEGIYPKTISMIPSMEALDTLWLGTLGP